MKTLVNATFLGLALIGLAACGNSGGTKPAAGGGGEKPAAGGGGDSGGGGGGGAEQAYDASKFKGSIKGSVKYSGEAQERLLPIGGDEVCTGAWNGKKALNQDFQVNADGTVPFAIIYVKSDVLKGFTFEAPTDRNLTIDQKDCYYSPHVFWVMAGEKFHVTNDDDTQHNVHAKPDRNDEINRAQAHGAKDTFSFAKKESKIVPFVCDVHSWMSAHCMVSDHPFVATTDDKGNFEITGLPPGEYTVKVWTKELGKAEAEVTVADAAVTQDFTTK